MADWTDVAPLLARWQLGVGPSGDGTLDGLQGRRWEVLRLRPGTGGDAWEVVTSGVRCADLPAAMAAAAVAADAGEEGG